MWHLCLHIWDFLFWKCSACGKFLRNSTGIMPKRKISSYHLYLSRQATLRVEVFKVFKIQVYLQLYILQWPQDWKRSVFITIPKKGNAKECSHYQTTAIISHASKVMLKIFQGRLQQYMNWEIPDVQAVFRWDQARSGYMAIDQSGFKKGRGTRDQITNIFWIIEKTKEFQKNMYFCFIDYVKAFDCVDHNKLWITTNCGKFLKR